MPLPINEPNWTPHATEEKPWPPRGEDSTETTVYAKASSSEEKAKARRRKRQRPPPPPPPLPLPVTGGRSRPEVSATLKSYASLEAATSSSIHSKVLHTPRYGGRHPESLHDVITGSRGVGTTALLLSFDLRPARPTIIKRGAAPCKYHEACPRTSTRSNTRRERRSSGNPKID